MSIFKSFIKVLLGKGVRKSYAQFGEDLIIRPFLQPGAGVYVDVGCYHPILYSNTYQLYRAGWSGIVIDPNPNLKKLFSFFRPRDRFVQTAIGTGTTATYFAFSDGAYNTLDAAHAEAYKKRTTLLSTQVVQLQPLSAICKDLTRIDVLNIDVEGLDLAVLQTHNWTVRPYIIIVEALPDSDVGVYLFAKGYELIGLTKLNSIFLDNERSQ